MTRDSERMTTARTTQTAMAELVRGRADDADAAVADLGSGMGRALFERRGVGALVPTVIAAVAHPPRPTARDRRGGTGRRARPCSAARIAVASATARSGCGGAPPTSAAVRIRRAQ